ncbi:MAG TPA: phosphotransferase [Euzebya sp.]|nr:phosphotransferase [Euzebya sp.]
MHRYKTFPPRWRNLRLPTSSRDAALATLALWSPCRRGGVLIQRLGWATVRVLGTGFLPGPTGPWDPPWDEATGGQLATRWRAAVGDFDDVGIYERPQAAREGFALLLLAAGRPVAFVKLRATEGDAVHPDLRHEHDVLRLVEAAGATAFTHPRALGLGIVGRWSYLTTSVMPLGLDRPAAVEDADVIIADIRRTLAQLPRGHDVPEGWEPMHGDLTPWNLRVRRAGGLTLVDWEDARWGPPGADAVLLHASRCALFGIAPPRLPREAADYWLQQVAEREEDPLDNQLRGDLVSALQRMAAGIA